MIDMTMSPDGATVTLLNATESVVVDLPAQGASPAKTIKASTLVAAGEGGAGLQTATFEGPVDYRETRAARGAAPAIDRRATARRLIVRTKPGLGDLQQAEFRGNVRFLDGAVRPPRRRSASTRWSRTASISRLRPAIPGRRRPSRTAS